MDTRYRSRSFALSQLHPDNRGMFISVVFLGGVIIAFLLAYVAFGQDVDLAPTSLRLVVVLHRHGDRTPTKTYENDPYKDEEKYWPLGWGQLTLRGKQQLYKLGKTFRKLYKGFVPFFSVKTVRVSSSDVDRTLMSAAAFLAGMFPPKDDQKWTDELNWQPIPIHTVPKDTDTLIALKAPCPKYNSEKDKVLAEIKGNETILDKELYEYITKNAGQKVESVREIETLYSCLFIEELNGYQLPEWTKKVYPQPMKEKTQMSFATFAWNTIMKRLHGGPFVNELLQNFQDKLTGKLKDKKLFLYSGHDITIVTLWRTFGFEEHILPSFGAALIWELHEFPDRNHYVKMFYMNNTDLNEPYTLQIPNCSDPCSLEEFSLALKEVRPIDWQHECQLDSKHPKLYSKLK